MDVDASTLKRILSDVSMEERASNALMHHLRCLENHHIHAIPISQARLLRVWHI